MDPVVSASGWCRWHTLVIDFDAVAISARALLSCEGQLLPVDFAGHWEHRHAPVEARPCVATRADYSFGIANSNRHSLHWAARRRWRTLPLLREPWRGVRSTSSLVSRLQSPSCGCEHNGASHWQHQISQWSRRTTYLAAPASVGQTCHAIACCLTQCRTSYHGFEVAMRRIACWQREGV